MYNATPACAVCRFEKRLTYDQQLLMFLFLLIFKFLYEKSMGNSFCSSYVLRNRRTKWKRKYANDLETMAQQYYNSLGLAGSRPMLIGDRLWIFNSPHEMASSSSAMRRGLPGLEAGPVVPLPGPPLLPPMMSSGAVGPPLRSSGTSPAFHPYNNPFTGGPLPRQPPFLPPIPGSTISGVKGGLPRETPSPT